MGSGYGCGTGVGRLQGLDVESGTGVSKPVWPVNYIPGVVCMAFCGRTLDKEAAVL